MSGYAQKQLLQRRICGLNVSHSAESTSLSAGNREEHLYEIICIQFERHR